jgi:dTMP kinase
MFITFEGIDYSGKSTQAKLLVEKLTSSGKDVLFLREPGGTELSEKIRSILLDKAHIEMSPVAELLLFSAARSQLVRQVIIPALAKKKIVVCDRFYDSTTAYQGYGRGIDPGDIASITRVAIAGAVPHVTFVIDVSVEEVTRRREQSGISADRMESAGAQFFENVRKGFLAIAQNEPNRVKVIDGTRSVEEIQKEIWNIVQQHL